MGMAPQPSTMHFLSPQVNKKLEDINEQENDHSSNLSSKSNSPNKPVENIVDNNKQTTKDYGLYLSQVSDDG